MTIKTKPGCRRVMNGTVRATDYVYVVRYGNPFGWVSPALSIGAKVVNGEVVRVFISKDTKIICKIICCRPVKTKPKK